MQDTAPKPQAKRPSIFANSSVIWLAVACVMGLILVGCALWFVAQTRSYEGRDCGQPLPWDGEGIEMQTVNAHWKTGSADARMALRSGYYPIARFTMGDCSGSGLLYISFHDVYGRQVGDTINLSYKDGKLQHRDEAWVKSTDKTAVCRIETGYQDATELEGHFLRQEEPLWRVVIKYRPEGESRIRTLGYACVQPVLQEESAQ